jgi:Zn-dependent protease with chaperone function
MKNQLDGLLAKANQPAAPLLVLPAMYDGYRTGTFTRSRTLILKEEFLDFLSPRERSVVIQHEAAHLIKPENKLKNIAEEFALNAKQICGKFGLALAAGVGVVAKATEQLDPSLFQTVANTVTKISPLLPLTPANMLLNATLNVLVAVPAAHMLTRFLSRKAEFASDRFVIDQHGNADMLTHTLLRYESYPDPAKHATIPMQTVLEKPKLGWQKLKDSLRWDNLMANHPSTFERIRAATAYAESKGAKPFLGAADTWRASVEPPLRTPAPRTLLSSTTPQ